MNHIQTAKKNKNKWFASRMNTKNVTFCCCCSFLSFSLITVAVASKQLIISQQWVINISDVVVAVAVILIAVFGCYKKIIIYKHSTSDKMTLQWLEWVYQCI